VNQRVEEDLIEEEVRLVDLINYSEGRDEFLNFQVGNEMGSVKDIMNFQEGSDENSYCQVAYEKISTKYLVDY
jgi:hypothetical protein